MTSIQHCHASLAFHQLQAVDSMHGGSVCGTFRSGGRQKVHQYYAPRILEVIAAERLGRTAAVSFIIVGKRATLILDLNCPRVYLFVHIMLRVQELSQNGLFDVIRHRVVALRGFLR